MKADHRTFFPFPPLMSPLKLRLKKENVTKRKEKSIQVTKMNFKDIYKTKGSEKIKPVTNKGDGNYGFKGEIK